MDWSLIPKHIVAIDANYDFSGGNFFMLDEVKGLQRCCGEDWDVDVLLSIRPESAIHVTNNLLRKIKELEIELYKLNESEE